MEASRSLVPEVTARTLRARVKNKPATLFLTALAFLADGTLSIRARQQSEIDQPKSQVQGMERTLAEMKQKMAELERQKAGAPADPPTPWRLALDQRHGEGCGGRDPRQTAFMGKRPSQ